MTDHSAWRISNAYRIARPFTSHSKVQACFVFGSAAMGFADQYSDLELGVIWSELPAADDLRQIADQAGVEAWSVEPYGHDRQSWLEQYIAHGLKVEAEHWSRDSVEAIIADVVDRHDTTHIGLVFVKQTTAFILQHSRVLHGHDLIGLWRSRLSPYPEGLAVSMVRHHLTFMPFDGQRVLAERQEIPMLYENRCAIVRRVLNILFGLNRMYHPGFKWTRHYIREMHLKPPDLFARLERGFGSDAGALDDLEQVVEETLSLVELHLPQIELRRQRDIFRRPCLRWQLPEST